MPEPAVTANAGCFGKLPQRGDFVTIRLPRDFVDPWDLFLRGFLAASREALGEAWLPAYLRGPIWRFAWAPGVMGSASVAGVLMPSVDRPGRYYPFTIALRGLTATDDLVEDPWFDAAEELALDVLEDTFDVETLDVRLASLGRPAVSARAAIGVGLVWTEGAEAVEPMALRAGPPTGASSAALLDGDWQRWGWAAEPMLRQTTGCGCAP